MIELPVTGRSTLLGKTGILVAYSNGAQHPALGRTKKFVMAVYATREELVICLAQNECGEPTGFDPGGLGGEVLMDLLVRFAARRIAPLPCLGDFQQIVKILKTETAAAVWHVVSRRGYKAACQQLRGASRN
jgi:hypothetical protein